MHIVSFDDWFKREANNENICFLCGNQLDTENKSDEHIFPKWILKEFNLWNVPITLLIKSKFNYRSAIVPSCKKCNNTSLSNLEKEIKNGIDGGFDYFVDSVSREYLYKWCQLIFYKILYKENFLKENIKLKESKKIISEEQFANLKLNHLFLRSIDKDVEFVDFLPGSIFICKVKTSDSDKSLNFDYMDAVPEQCLGIRINDIGIIAILADAGLQELVKKEDYSKYTSHILAPIQFKNLFANCVYQQMLFRDPFKYKIEFKSSDKISIIREPKDNFNGNVYEQGNSTDHSQLLGSFFNCDPYQFYMGEGLTGSFFFDDNGAWKDRAFEDDGTIKNSVE